MNRPVLVEMIVHEPCRAWSSGNTAYAQLVIRSRTSYGLTPRGHSRRIVLSCRTIERFLKSSGRIDIPQFRNLPCASPRHEDTRLFAAQEYELTLPGSRGVPVRPYTQPTRSDWPQEKNIKLTGHEYRRNKIICGELKCEIYLFVAVACFLVSIVFAATEPLNVRDWPLAGD